MVKLMRVNILTANRNDLTKSPLCQFWSRKWTLEICPFEAENASEYTKSHLKFQKFSGGDTPGPPQLGAPPQTPDRVPLLWLTQLSDSSRAPGGDTGIFRAVMILIERICNAEYMSSGRAILAIFVIGVQWRTESKVLLPRLIGDRRQRDGVIRLKASPSVTTKS